MKQLTLKYFSITTLTRRHVLTKKMLFHNKNNKLFLISNSVGVCYPVFLKVVSPDIRVRDKLKTILNICARFNKWNQMKISAHEDLRMLFSNIEQIVNNLILFFQIHHLLVIWNYNVFLYFYFFKFNSINITLNIKMIYLYFTFKSPFTI